MVADRPLKESCNQSTYQDLCIEEEQKSENLLSLNKVESEVFTLCNFLILIIIRSKIFGIIHSQKT